MMRLHNLPQTTARRRDLRKRLTPAEATLWRHLQGSQFQGMKFRRQHGVGPYVLDFFCAAARLAIELDGASHDHEAAYTRDRTRDIYLRQARIRVLRFENRNVVENLEGVLDQIGEALAAR